MSRGQEQLETVATTPTFESEEGPASESNVKRKKRKGKVAAIPEKVDTAVEDPAPADTGTTARKKKKRKRATPELTREDTQAAGDETAGGLAEEKEPEFSFQIDAEEDVLTLEPEPSSAEKENTKDAQAKQDGKARMAKLDKSRTAGGVFKGIGFGEGPMRVLPLYAQLPARDQLAPFKDPPEGERIVIISTNVAETSVTLPNVRFVVDCGQEKRRKYRAASEVSSFTVDRISKASADQRAGRAGRLGPGHTYRLYSAAAYENHFTAFAPIPMLHTPMDPVLLLLAFLGVPRLDAFPWPTPPPPEAVAAAVRRLRVLGAIADDSTPGDFKAAVVKCTKLGFRLASLPVAPRYAKMLLASVAASQQLEGSAHIVGHACAIVAALSIGNLTCWEQGVAEDTNGDGAGENEMMRTQREAQQRLAAAQKKEAPKWSQLRDDLEGLLWIMGGYSWAIAGGEDAAERFCRANRINSRQISEAHSLMQQLATLLHKRLALATIGIDMPLPVKLKPPNLEQAQKLRECIVDGLMDRVAVARPELGIRAFACADLGQEIPVFIHTTSNAFRHRPHPAVLVFNEIIASTKPFMRDCIALDPMLLARRTIAGDCPLLKLGEFLSVPAPRYLREQDSVLAFGCPTYAPLAYALPTVEVNVPADNIFRYKVFAKALLEGEVLAGLPHPKAQLLARPSIFLNAPTNPRVSSIVGALWERRVGSRAELVKRWAEDSRFLLEGYLKWLPVNFHEDVRISWPPKGVAPRQR